MLKKGPKGPFCLFTTIINFLSYTFERCPILLLVHKLTVISIPFSIVTILRILNLSTISY
ncbi:Uncharacterised protein [Serratia marcescens]|nr:Uncharacterised protein [Serratia marcescens]